MANDANIVSAVRPPIGTMHGARAGVASPELGAKAIRAALDRAAVEAQDIDEVIMPLPDTRNPSR